MSVKPEDIAYIKWGQDVLVERLAEEVFATERRLEMKRGELAREVAKKLLSKPKEKKSQREKGDK
jgi:ActR/RegA family two-component response regulator